MSYLELRAGNFFPNHLAFPSHPINRSEFRPTTSFDTQQQSYRFEPPPMSMMNPTTQHQHVVGHHPFNQSHLVHGIPPGLPCPAIVDSMFRFPMPPGLYNVQASSPPVDYLRWQSSIYQQQQSMNYQPIHSDNCVERTNCVNQIEPRIEQQTDRQWFPYDQAAAVASQYQFMQPAASEIQSARPFEESYETNDETTEEEVVDPIQRAILIASSENDEDQTERVEDEDEDDYVDVAESFEEDDFEELESCEEYQIEKYDNEDIEDKREIVVENDIELSDIEEEYDDVEIDDEC